MSTSAAIGSEADQDEAFMRRALALAALGRGWVGPNPMVGAVVVQSGKIMGEGHHPGVGQPHAEVFALDAAGEGAKGATLYVSLEPCNHFGRTPPCTGRVIASGVSRVVMALDDVNPRTAGQARDVLEAAGIEVTSGVLAEEARTLNAPFFKYITTGLPLVICKMALSLDGKIATRTGDSQWISGPAARELVGEWRATYAAVMVGAGTVMVDNPSLTCRIAGAHSPWRIVVDPLAQAPTDARWIGSDGKAIMAVSPQAPPHSKAALAGKGVQLLECPLVENGIEIDLRFLLAELGRREIPSVLLEGGGGLNASALGQGVVDELRFFVAPLLIGGKQAPTPVAGEGIAELAQAIRARIVKVEKVGEDLLIEARLPANGMVSLSREVSAQAL